jgi:hypothetical protein
MYIMYVDESGDSGLSAGSPTTHFALSGLVVHERDWRAVVDQLVQFRKALRSAYGLPVRAEIHASDYINRKAHGLKKHVRLAILRNFLDELAKMPAISITNIIVDKTNKSSGCDVFERAWQALFQRFENTLKYGNFPGAHKNDYGIAITDATNGRKLMRLTRRMSVINYIPHDAGYSAVGSRNEPITRIIEDPHGRNSAEALPIQACDVCAYFLTQKFNPNGYIRRQHAQHYIDRLRPVLNTRASRSNALGIVVL